MAMTRKDIRRWTEDPMLKGKRERCRRRRKFMLQFFCVNVFSDFIYLVMAIEDWSALYVTY
jgi:hypothetical protein